MKREEEIEKEAKRVSWNSDEYDYFILGAEWADKTMIDKACEWLVDNARNYIVSNGGGCWYDSVKLKHAFKKAMEE